MVPFGDLHERANALEAFTELPYGGRVAVQPEAIRLVVDDVAGRRVQSCDPGMLWIWRPLA